MNAALMALDRVGPNAAQAQGFLRDDAWLLLVFLTNDDDCSVPEGESLSEELFDRCWLLDDTDDGGPLIPVANFVARYRALKVDPDRVAVAVLGGDSDADDPAVVASERAAYVASKSDPKTCYVQTYICTDGQVPYEWSSRYQTLVEGFGDRGAFFNLCGDVEAAALSAADFLADVVRAPAVTDEP